MDSETKVYFRQQIHPGPKIAEEQDHVANDLSSFIVKKMEIYTQTNSTIESGAMSMLAIILSSKKIARHANLN